MRPEKVNDLTNAASEGIRQMSVDATAAEILSACLTLAARAVAVAQDMGIHRDAIRAAVEELWLRAQPPTKES